MSEATRSDRAEVDRKLLELLVCPLTKTILKWDTVNKELISRSAGLAYPVRDGVPVMLPIEARAISDEERGLGGSVLN